MTGKPTDRDRQGFSREFRESLPPRTAIAARGEPAVPGDPTRSGYALLRWPMTAEERAAFHRSIFRIVSELREQVGDDAAFEDSGDRARLIRRLTELRERAGLSQAEVAERAGLRLRDVRAFEDGAMDPRLSFHQRYARAIGARVRVGIEETP